MRCLAESSLLFAPADVTYVVRLRILLLAGILSATFLAGSLLLARAPQSQLEVTASLQPQRLTADDPFTIHVELRNRGSVPVEFHEQSCEPLQIKVSNSSNQPVWESHAGCVLTWQPSVVYLEPNKTLQTTQCFHYVDSLGSCAGYSPALATGRYRGDWHLLW
jgi:hypothetical protein